MTQINSETTAISELNEDIPLRSEIRPDIYIIVMDGYACEDVLKSLYQFNNSKFIEQLEELGFYVADQSHSNYVQTIYSMASF
jgi:hypothetical protein